MDRRRTLEKEEEEVNLFITNNDQKIAPPCVCLSEAAIPLALSALTGLKEWQQLTAKNTTKT